MTVLHNRDRVATEQRGWSTAGYVVDYEKSPLPPAPSTSTTACSSSSGARGTAGTPSEVFDLGRRAAPADPQPGVVAFEVDSRFHDIGTPEAVRETEGFLSRTPPVAR